MKKSWLVTGGCGFLGSALVRRMVHDGYRVRVLDDQSRGSAGRLADLEGHYEFLDGDIRDPAVVAKAVKGMNAVCHMAFVNGTEFFYTMPDLVLDVGVRGMLNVIDACLAGSVGELLLASSSEVYQTAPIIPTNEQVPLSIPDPLNPRYSYASGKLISEVLALNYGRSRFDKVVVFRPHNVYGPQMGWEHVVPQFVIRMKQLVADSPGPYRFPIQGTGDETRSFVYIDDFTDGLMLLAQKGEHLNIYHIGTMEEVTIRTLAGLVAEYFDRQVEIVPGQIQKGGPNRRCPDIAKIKAMGYKPRYSLREGLAVTCRWYDENSRLAPERITPLGGDRTACKATLS
jgi:nucleoside-diphosphate-sugar epimerase